MIRGAARLVLAAAALGALPGALAAEPAGDAVALLPLDADRSLEIYGQPVASEIARALAAGNLPVVVLGPRMAVPERVRLIVDGTITRGGAGAVTIALRIRNSLDGVVLETLAATAPTLARIDGAAAELSARLAPIVRGKLAALHPASGGEVVRPAAPRPQPTAERTVLIAIASDRQASPGPLASALDAAVARWTHAHHRPLRKIEPAELAPRAVAAAGTDLAIGFWILGWSLERPPETPGVAVARGRVRVRVAGPGAVLFDRVVITDSVVGDRGLGDGELAARVAREVLAILGPHLGRSVPSWQ